MAEINDLDLQLNIIAKDAASEVLKALMGVLDDFRLAVKELQDINPFLKMQEGADKASINILDDIDSLKRATSELEDINPFSRWTAEAGTFAKEASTASDRIVELRNEIASSMNGNFRDPFASMDTNIKDAAKYTDELNASVRDVEATAATAPFAPWVTSVQSVRMELTGLQSQLADIGATIGSLSGVSIGSGSKKSSSSSKMPSEQAMTDWFANLGANGQGNMTQEQYTEWARAAANNDIAGFWQQYGSALGGPTVSSGSGASGSTPKTPKKTTPLWYSSLSKLTSGLSELPMKAMYGGMNLMMGYYGLQAIANGGNDFASIQRMMQINNQNPNQAAQSMAMLGTAGLAGTQGTDFLSSLAANMQKTFTPAVGSGTLSQNAILLQSLGITQQDITTSPWELLNTIGVRYRGFMGQGQTNKANELLNLTGTTQLASVLENWSSLNKSASSINLGMSAKDVNNAVSQNVNMQMSMQKLALAFDELAIKLTPVVDRVTSALTDLMGTSKKGQGPLGTFVSNIETAAKDLGPLVSSIVAATLALKAIQFGSDVAAGMGLLEAGGGMTAGKLIGKGLGKLGLGAGATAASDVAGGAAGFSILDMLPPAAILGLGAASLQGTHPTSTGEPIGKNNIPPDPIGIFHFVHGLDSMVSGWFGGGKSSSNSSQQFSQQALRVMGTQGTDSLMQMAEKGTLSLSDFKSIGNDYLMQLSQKGNLALSGLSQNGLQQIENLAKSGDLQFGVLADTGMVSISNLDSKGATALQNLQQSGQGYLSEFSNNAVNVITNASNSQKLDVKALSESGQLHLEQLQSAGLISLGSLQKDGTQQVTALNKQGATSLASLMSSGQASLSSMDSKTESQLKTIVTTHQTLATKLEDIMKTAMDNIQKDLLASNIPSTKVSGNVASWVKSAMKDAGVNGSDWTNMLDLLITKESSGNPRAYNRQSVYGEHATGLAQMLPTTFSQYADYKLGPQSIYDPVDNLTAAINYIQSRYGSPQQLMQQTGLGTTSYKGYASGGVISEPIVGIGLNSGTHYMFGEEGDEAIVPLAGASAGGTSAAAPAGRRSSNGGHTFNVSINVSGAGKDTQQMAKEVADYFVQQVKLRANVDLSF